MSASLQRNQEHVILTQRDAYFKSAATAHLRHSLRAFFSGYLAYDEMLRKRGEVPAFETFRELLDRDPRQHGGAMRKIKVAIERFGFVP